MELYHKMCDFVKKINSTFTFPLIFTTFYFLISNMMCFYYILNYILRDESIIPIMLTDGLAIIFHYILQGISLHLSVGTSGEFRETPILISKIINNNVCNETDQEVFKNFLVQIQYRNVNFENFLFAINWKLLLTVRKILTELCTRFKKNH